MDQSNCCNANIRENSDICSQCGEHCSPMTEISVEELAKEFEEDNTFDGDGFLYDAHGNVVPQGVANEIAFLREQLSAERNANLEKIKELRERNSRLFHFEKENQILSAQIKSFAEANERYLKQMNAMSEGFRNPNGVKGWKEYQALESKLAEAEKKYEEHREATLDGDCPICDYEKLTAEIASMEDELAEAKDSESLSMKIAKLEAEAKAVRSKTEEFLKALEPIRQGGYGGASFIVQEAIRALNSEKGEQV